MVKFTKTAVLTALEEIVEELGENYVYPKWDKAGCTYAEEGEPSCIVGRVIAKLDPNLFEDTRAVEEARKSSWAVSGFHSSQEEYDGAVESIKGYPYGDIRDIPPVLEAEEGVRKILRTAQALQDSGETYAWALSEAKRVAYDIDHEMELT